MRIIQMDGVKDARRWDDYVAPRASTITDLSAWRQVVHEAYGMRSHFIAAEKAGNLVGALSLYEVRHPIFGHYLATAAFGNDGGFHFDDQAAKEALLAEAKTLADLLKVKYLLIRAHDLEHDGFRVDRRREMSVIDLAGGEDAIWKDKIGPKTRNQIRRGAKEGFIVKSGHAQLRAFHDVFHRHMRELGSPAHSVRYYELIVEHFGDRMDFLVARDGNDVAAGALYFWINGMATNLHTVALQRYNRRCPNYLIYWQLTKSACAHECKWLNMGRSLSGGPNAAFKRNWGPEIRTIPYNYYLRTLRDVPFQDPRNLRYRIPIATWKRMPLFLTKALGPHFIHGLI